MSNPTVEYLRKRSASFERAIELLKHTEPPTPDFVFDLLERELKVTRMQLKGAEEGYEPASDS